MAKFVAFITPLRWWWYTLRAVVEFALWMAATLAIAYGIGRLKWWWRSYGSAHWPEVSGRVEKAQWDYVGQESSTVAEVWYSYEVNGERYGQVLERDFVDPDQATDYVMAIREKELRIRYRPDKPQESVVSTAL